MNKKSVLIMMATYNGQAYLEQQIESILCQSYDNWHLVIQDDRSNDQTVKIIQKYCRMDSRVSFLSNDTCFHGPYYNFNLLANRCKKMKEYDFYMFCDQDDLWNADKIEVFVNSIEKTDIPILLYGDMSLMGAKDEPFPGTINSQFYIQLHSPYTVFYSHKIFGCNMIMNLALFKTVPVLDLNQPNYGILAHDALYATYAAVFGRIQYLDKPTMRYRRHGQNVTGEKSYKPSLTKIINRILNFDSLGKAHAICYNQSLIAIDLMKQNSLQYTQKQMLRDVEDVILLGGCHAIRQCIKQKVVWGGFVENMSRLIVLYTGVYKKYLI